MRPRLRKAPSPPSSAPVALKVAMFSNDPRFAREVELLTRVHHPSVPQLLDRGWWHSAEGVAHPYVVMEWIRGRPLYDWAREANPSSRQVLLATLLVLGMGATWWMAPASGKAESEMLLLQEPALAVAPEEETTGLGDGGVTTRVVPPDNPLSTKLIALEVAYEWNGACYLPLFVAERSRVPTTDKHP
jgi:hypothetical protein